MLSRIGKFNWGGKEVLIVEDNRANIAFLKAILKNSNVSVKVVRNEEKALEFINSNPSIDLIILNISLFVVNDWDVVSKLKKINKYAPIIIQTAQEIYNFYESLIDIGIKKVFFKTVDVYVFMAGLDEYLG